MFFARRAALRILSNPSNPSFVTSRSITSFARSPLQNSRPGHAYFVQKRWATNEAEAKEEVPVSHLQPTSQEEVENTISEDNAAAQVEDNAVTAADSAVASQASQDIDANQQDPIAQETDSSQELAVDRTVSAVSDAVSAAGAATGLGGESSQAASRVGRPQPTPKTTIYIGNLFFDVTENDLTKEIARFGTVKRVRLIRDARGLSKGFGYVEFESLDSAQKAIDSLNQQLFEGRRLHVAFATTEFQGGRGYTALKSTNPPTKTLFIGNMSFEMTDRDLNNLFRGIRNVVDVRVAIDRRTGQPRGFAHADFIDVKSAMEAMEVLKQKETYGRRLRIDYSYGPSTAPRNTPSDQSS